MDAPQGAYAYGMLLAGEHPSIPTPDGVVQDATKAKKSILRAAVLGSPEAQERLGVAYANGDLGCELNPVLSIYYYYLAARQGRNEAERVRSNWFLTGWPGILARNESLAYSYARNAAEDGLETAVFAMGYFYEMGVHVSRDLQKAQAWYSKAAGTKERASKDCKAGLQK